MSFLKSFIILNSCLFHNEHPSSLPPQPPFLLIYHGNCFIKSFFFFANLVGFMVAYYLLMLQFLSKSGRISDSFNQISM